RAVRHVATCGPQDVDRVSWSGLSHQFILPRRSERFWIGLASLQGLRRSHVLCRRTQTSENFSEQASSHPSVPYAKGARKFHADWPSMAVKWWLPTRGRRRSRG